MKRAKQLTTGTNKYVERAKTEIYIYIYIYIYMRDQTRTEEEIPRPNTPWGAADVLWMDVSFFLPLQLARVFDEVERDFHLLGATAVEDKYAKNRTAPSSAFSTLPVVFVAVFFFCSHLSLLVEHQFPLHPVFSTIKLFSQVAQESYC